jgi:putative membrane protein
MHYPLAHFFIHWAITALSLWAASRVFKGVAFDSPSDLFVSALLLGFVNAIVKPLLVMLTLPLTFLTFGAFLLVINALMILLVSSWVKGFRVAGFWAALGVRGFVAVLSALMAGVVLSGGGVGVIQMPMPMGHGWI